MVALEYVRLPQILRNLQRVKDAAGIEDIECTPQARLMAEEYLERSVPFFKQLPIQRQRELFRTLELHYSLISEFKAVPPLGHLIGAFRVPRIYFSVLGYVLSGGRVERMVFEASLLVNALSAMRWQEAVKLDPSLVESAKINATNYDPSKTIPVDMTRMRRRTG